MRIVLLPTPDGDVIAREDQLGRLEASFVVMPDGQVFYHHPWDSHPAFAGVSISVFRAAAIAWNRYSDGVYRTDEEGLEAVAKLRAEMAKFGVLDNRQNNLWQALVEQAEHGLL